MRTAGQWRSQRSMADMTRETSAVRPLTNTAPGPAVKRTRSMVNGCRGCYPPVTHRSPLPSEDTGHSPLFIGRGWYPPPQAHRWPSLLTGDRPLPADRPLPTGDRPLPADRQGTAPRLRPAAAAAEAAHCPMCWWRATTVRRPRERRPQSPV